MHPTALSAPEHGNLSGVVRNFRSLVPGGVAVADVLALGFLNAVMAISYAATSYGVSVFGSCSPAFVPYYWYAPVLLAKLATV